MVHERKNIYDPEDKLPEWFRKLIELLKKEKELSKDAPNQS